MAWRFEGLLAHSEKQSLEDYLRLACATGTATAMTPGTKLAMPEDVEKLMPLVKISRI